MTDQCKHEFGRRRDKDGKLIGRGMRKCALCGQTEVLPPKTALVELRRQVNEGSFGPAMANLTDMQQRFVTYLLDTGTNNYSEAARVAGYSRGGSEESVRAQAYRLAHDEKVQAAIREEGQRGINAMTGLAIMKLHSRLSNDETPKEQMKAIEMVLNRAGLHATSEHRLTVEHVTEDDKVRELKAMAAVLNVDPKVLLGRAGIIEAEFVEVKP